MYDRKDAILNSKDHERTISTKWDFDRIYFRIIQFFSGFKDALSHENMGHTWDMEMFEQLVVHNYKAGIGPKVNETHRHK